MGPRAIRTRRPGANGCFFERRGPFRDFLRTQGVFHIHEHRRGRAPKSFMEHPGCFWLILPEACVSVGCAHNNGGSPKTFTSEMARASMVSVSAFQGLEMRNVRAAPSAR